MKFTIANIFTLFLILSVKAQDQVFRVSQIMPRLEACKDLQEPTQIRTCMQEKLTARIAENLKYPSEAEEAGQEGLVIVEFIIRKDGSMEEIKVTEDPGFGMADAAVKAISKTKRDWVPGTNFGEKVDVMMTVPVTFELPEEEETKVMPEVPDFYTVVDQMPRFKGCEEVGAELASACTRDLSIAYVNANLKYPPAAQEAKLEGEVHAEFIVDEEGKVIQPKVTKSLSEETDAEVIRLLKEMPQWVPGKHKGQKVKVKMTMPFRFRMASED